MNATRAIHSAVRLAEIFPPEAIHVGLKQPTKSAVIEHLVGRAVSLGQLPREAAGPIVEAILERESLGSTALGHGVAFPHCRWRSLERFVGLVGLLQPAIPFDAADDLPVDTVFLTLAPPGHAEPYYEVLGQLVAIGQDESRHLLLRDCRTPEQVSAFLDELDPPATGRPDELARMSLSWRDRETRDPWRELAMFSLTRDARPGREGAGEGVRETRWL